MQSTQPIFQTLPNISFLLSEPVFFGILALFFIIYVAVSIALVYHWTQYGMHNVKVVFAETVFIVVSVLLFSISLLALNYF